LTILYIDIETETSFLLSLIQLEKNVMIITPSCRISTGSQRK